MKKLLQAIGLASALGACTTTPSESYTPQVIKVGYNAIETGVAHTEATDKNTIKTRVFTNVGIENEIGGVFYHGLNTLHDVDEETYFGRHVFGLGKRTIGIEGIVALKTNSHEIIDKRYGVRDTNIIRALGATYGWIDVAGNNESLEFTSLYGKDLGKGWTVETLQSLKTPFGGDISHYFEVQGFKRLAPHISLFGRVEVSNPDIHDWNLENRGFMTGIVIDF